MASSDCPTLAVRRLQKAEAFQIACTPPEVKARRRLEARQRASSEVALLVLAPFKPIPRVAFDEVKLGSAEVRKICIQNPSGKPVRVLFTSLPQQRSGFELDYPDFTLGPRQEATLHVGWVPQAGGNVNEKFVVKYANKVTRILVVGTCVAPSEKRTGRRPPLASSNRTQSGARKKDGTGAPKKPALPDNPVVRKTGEQPETRPMQSTENSPPVLLSMPPSHSGATASWSPQKLCDPVTESSLLHQNLASASTLEETHHSVLPHPRAEEEVRASAASQVSPLKDYSNRSNIRRETFVKVTDQGIGGQFKVPQQQQYPFRRDTFVKESSFISSTPFSKTGVHETPGFMTADVSVINNEGNARKELSFSCAPVHETKNRRDTFSMLKEDEGPTIRVDQASEKPFDEDLLQPSAAPDLNVDVSRILREFTMDSPVASRQHPLSCVTEERSGDVEADEENSVEDQARQTLCPTVPGITRAFSVDIPDVSRQLPGVSEGGLAEVKPGEEKHAHDKPEELMDPENISDMVREFGLDNPQQEECPSLRDSLVASVLHDVGVGDGVLGHRHPENEGEDIRKSR